MSDISTALFRSSSACSVSAWGSRCYRHSRWISFARPYICQRTNNVLRVIERTPIGSLRALQHRAHSTFRLDPLWRVGPSMSYSFAALSE
jgi:hypothetical protein